MKMVKAQLCRVAVMSAVLAGTLAAQGPAVTGQVTIQERPGETTEDLGNVVVFLESRHVAGPRTRPPTPATAVIALDKRQFSPRVRVITEGSTVEFPNQDPFSHNVFSKTSGGFDTGVYGRNKTRDQTFLEPGVYPLYCNVHPRMTAFVIALKTPHFAQAGADGRFVLDKVPPGEYTLSVWHDRASMVTRDVTVPPAGLGNLKLEMDARSYKYVQHKNKIGKDYTSATGDRY